MTVFLLPDLGEGLPDAEIHAWHVELGDVVEVDQTLVSMETAKAVVEVPAVQAGKILKRFGAVGDIIKTGAPLVEFASQAKQTRKDTGTVVGKIDSNTETAATTFIIGSNKPPLSPSPRTKQTQINPTTPPENFQRLHGTHRTMAALMSASHRDVVPATLYDDANINHLRKNHDLTVKTIQALCQAAAQVPALNAWFDTASISRQCHHHVNLGIAIDTGDDLLVPVINACEARSASELRECLDSYKEAARSRQLRGAQLRGATIILSNFGSVGGRYATPIVVPPSVAIIGVGRAHDAVIAQQGVATVQRILPLSLSFDHRAVTGAEAARFLTVMIQTLEQETI
jgi:2-oxoisovalerate dehydrogenase E2 component (dihydrolipoyl transacylase)